MSNFIPKPYKKEQITIRLTPTVIETIDSLANQYKMSRNEFINQCIDYALRNMPAPEEQQD